VNCLAVREVLPELAVGVLPPRDREEVDRHLRWCAGCRKESSDLGQAAATIAFALEPAGVPRGLEDRVVERVRRAAGRRGTPRRIRTTAAALVAAMVAVGSLGWGAVMAGRADRFEERAQQAQQDLAEAVARFRTAVTQVIPGVEPVVDEEMKLGRLQPGANSFGGGFVIQLVSPTTIDFTMVIVSGLDPEAAERVPYRVQLFNAQGEMLRAGRIEELDADGGAEVLRQFEHDDLTGYTTVHVVDAAGEPVLTGVIGRR
jgi:anti-sigma factor RsiW